MYENTPLIVTIDPSQCGESAVSVSEFKIEIPGTVYLGGTVHINPPSHIIGKVLYSAPGIKVVHTA